ncbi:succinate dehydrogenase subunit C [Candidatus Koribacter versatilis Ellin345]|uniref:Succinate dehydrogenase subunit C n=1 Tax=Koribacter versatilis (strain Ellin345) TaxID=204669 RepID=Q1INH9_KORVE|nr:succinate dehydrogenase subunit C [Candidatus Koribacter versatilis Ellin345]
MAASASPTVQRGVPPLRAGQGTSFLLRRLHSLSGIIPVGAFLVEHFVSNAFATNGPHAYAEQVKFLTGLPFAEALEWVGIYIPLLYHAIYGFYIWFRGEGNVTEYPWSGNWMYTAQRWTGLIAFIYIGWHVYTMRVLGPHLFGYTNGVPGYTLAFGKVQNEVLVTWAFLFYVVGIVAASWHFAYGIWLFCAKWGITVGDNARRKFGYVCVLIALAFIFTGFATLYSFRSSKYAGENVKVHDVETQQSAPQSNY